MSRSKRLASFTWWALRAAFAHGAKRKCVRPGRIDAGLTESRFAERYDVVGRGFRRSHNSVCTSLVPCLSSISG